MQQADVTVLYSYSYRFIPQYWKSKDLKDLPVAKQQELDELNTDVLAKLADKNLFSQGETAEGRVCIKIGLVRVTFSIYSCNLIFAYLLYWLGLFQLFQIR